MISDSLCNLVVQLDAKFFNMQRTYEESGVGQARSDTSDLSSRPV